MKQLILIVLIVFFIGFSFISLYRAICFKKDLRNTDDVQPLNNIFVIWLALTVGFFVVLAFILLYNVDLHLNNNIGQVGDFIGGLLNPALSFLALLVLLRTTFIQTAEAKKTTKFMGAQQKILEIEKFENTFFQLLDRLEKYCETHLRVGGEVAGITVVSKCSERLLEKTAEFNRHHPFTQYRLAKKHSDTFLDNDTYIGFMLRAVRVMKLVDRAKLSISVRRSYMGVLRDTMLPDERIALSTYLFFDGKVGRALMRKWDVDFLNEKFYVCSVVSDYFQGESVSRAWS
ncbi:hypothetical protein BSZ28_18460 [Pseudomonas moraviensis]|nr:hypothetical protein BSZ28_18460 [Pseudomonas moraviensis]